jgi:hypothetical protein
MKLVTTTLEWTRSGPGKPMCGPRRFKPQLHSSCYVVIRFGLLMEQDQASKPLHRSPQGKNRREGRKQNRSLPRMPSLRNRLRHPQNRWIRLFLLKTSLRPGAESSRTRSSPPNPPNARFLGWLPLISRDIFRVALRSWNVPTVQARAPSNRVVGSCGSNLMTNAKRTLSLPSHDGSSAKRSGKWLAGNALFPLMDCPN